MMSLYVGNIKDDKIDFVKIMKEILDSSFKEFDTWEKQIHPREYSFNSNEININVPRGKSLPTVIIAGGKVYYISSDLIFTKNEFNDVYAKPRTSVKTCDELVYTSNQDSQDNWYNGDSSKLPYTVREALENQENKLSERVKAYNINNKE